MAKTRQEWIEISETDPKKLLYRIRNNSKRMEELLATNISATPEDTPELGDLADELIYIMLSILRIVVVQNKWKDVTPMDLFEGVFYDTAGWAWSVVLGRFRDTKELARKYKDGDKHVKKSLKPLLVSRGLI